MRHNAGISAQNLGQNQFFTCDFLGFSFANKYCNEAGDQYVVSVNKPFLRKPNRYFKPQRMNG